MVIHTDSLSSIQSLRESTCVFCLDDEVEDEADSIQDRELDERITGECRSGQFVNELEESDTSSDLKCSK